MTTDIVQHLQMQNDIMSMLTLEQMIALDAKQTWFTRARPDQCAPSDYFVWLLLAGRGSGKTRAGAEEIWFPAFMGDGQRIAVIGPTSNDVRKTCFEGESGLLSVIPPSLIDSYNRTGLEMWLKPCASGRRGAYFVGYSAEEPNRLRGPQHHRAWCDELAAWRYLEDTWDMMMFGLRLGNNPNVIVTTTPKPVGLLRELMVEPDTMISRASMFDNAANLPPKILAKLKKKYEGTRLGRQELYAEMISANPYALWQQVEMIDTHRVRRRPELARVVVAVDPPITSGEDADECGIVGAGVNTVERGSEHLYVLADKSTQGTPEEWAKEACDLYHSLGADCIVAEVNQGGEMVRSVIANQDPSVPVRMVHATRGKVVRAEPVSMLYEQGRGHHVGRFGTLEDQMCDFTSDFDRKVAGYSPDRVDALVWAATELIIKEPGNDGRAGSLF